jgi:hypothetical protein
MISTQPARLIVVIFAALAMIVFVNARFAFSQEVTDPGADADSDAVADSGTSVDASWDRSGPAIDEDAESADEVLEIPQATCPKDGAPASCDSSSDDDSDDDDGQAINAPSPGAPPTVFDDDTASSGAPDPDWGSVDDYQNQQVYAGPYSSYPYPYSITVAVPQRLNRPSQVSASAFAPMSSPITQAAQPPLNQGPWMNPPTMSAFSRPAGSPMMPMMMSGRSFGFHH